MTKAVYLDTGVLGIVTHPRADKPEVKECIKWLHRMLEAGVRVCVPEVCDYELRRAYILNKSNTALARLESLNFVVTYIPLNTQIMRRAAHLWADARASGQPTADDKELDVDVLLAAQALETSETSERPVIATTNVGHLSRFVTADSWQDIEPD